MKKMLILLSLVVMLMVIPFFINHGGSYGGSDNQAESLVTRIAPNYKPWFTPLYEPASSEIESLLFTLQGSLGTAVIFYILGYYKGRDHRRTGTGTRKSTGDKRIRYGRHAGN
jgi:cobalt/nickel transport protein